MKAKQSTSTKSSISPNATCTGKDRLYLNICRSKEEDPENTIDKIILIPLSFRQPGNSQLENLNSCQLKYLEEKLLQTQKAPTLPPQFHLQEAFRKVSQEVTFLVIDGTRFKYDELYPFKILRETEIKKVRSHVKTLVLSVHLENGKRFVLTVLPEQSYASEVKAGEKIIYWPSHRGFILNVLREKPLSGRVLNLRLG